MGDLWTMSTETLRLGATPRLDGVSFGVWSGSAERMWVCLFGQDGARESDRIEMMRDASGVFTSHVAGGSAGMRYGFRADGPYDPDRGFWFDPDKQLVDPYAIAIDRPYLYDSRLAAPRGRGGDTASLMPKAIATALPEPVAAAPPLFKPGGLIYEVQVKGFSVLHPQVPAALRGTVAALAHPAIIDYLLSLKVSAIELMPVTAWIDERHLGPLGLTNAWGYNPVTFMTLDPRIVPGGLAELRATVKALRQAGIGVILDLVFNHTGESDARGPTLSLRGLDNRAYYRHDRDERLVNDTGTGNTIACDHPAVRRLIVDSLQHFVLNAGVDGFRFDLAPILGRTDAGFDPSAETLGAIREDPVLKDRILIAEPWDIGPGGYQLGKFPPPFLEWNDRYRDDMRRFWRGDRGLVGALATGLAGSFNVFSPQSPTRTVNCLSAHDGFALADVVAFERKHNEANGEMNRDGHNENYSWNNGIEGLADDPPIAAARIRDLRAMLSTLFFSRGTIMLTAGDEFGRTQQGNNNAYAQDNPIGWLDWAARDRDLEAFVVGLTGIRASLPALSATEPLTGETDDDLAVADVEWLGEDGVRMGGPDWNDPARQRLTMVLACQDGARAAITINGDRRASVFEIPRRDGWRWQAMAASVMTASGAPLLAGRSCGCFFEVMV